MQLDDFVFGCDVLPLPLLMLKKINLEPRFQAERDVPRRPLGFLLPRHRVAHLENPIWFAR